MVVGQAGSIVKMRIGAAAQRAEGEVGLMNAKFLSDLTSLDPKTGEFKIKPEDFESAFANHKATLEGYADTTDFALAKDAIRGVAMKALPELYVRGAQAMNVQMFAKMDSDWTAGFMALKNSFLPPKEKYDKLILAIDSAGKQGWSNPAKIAAYRAQVTQEYNIDNATEVAQGLGSLQDGIAMLSDDTARNAAGLGNLSPFERDTVLKSLSDKQKANGQNAIQYYDKFFDDSVDKFVDVADIEKKLNMKDKTGKYSFDISPSDKDKILAKAKIHNSDSRFDYFEERISGTNSIPQLKLYENQLMNEEKVGPWEGRPAEKDKEYLLNRIRTKIDSLDPTKGDKDPSIVQAQIDSIYQMFESQSRPISFGEAWNSIRLLGTTDTATTAVKQAHEKLRKFMPQNSQEAFIGLEKLVRGGGDKSWAKNPEGASWVMDQAQDFGKRNPTGLTSGQYQEEFTRLGSVYLSREFEYLKGKKIEDGNLGNAGNKKLYELGSKLQTSKLADSAISIDPQTNMVEVAPILSPAFGQLQAQEKAEAMNRFGKDVRVQVNEDGSRTLVGDDGGKYRFLYNEKDKKAPPKLIDMSGKEVLELPPEQKPKKPTTPEDKGPAIQEQKQINLAIDDVATIKDQTARARKIKLYVNSGISLSAFEEEGFSSDGSKDPGNNRTIERQNSDKAAERSASERDKAFTNKQKVGAKLIADRTPSILNIKTDSGRLEEIRSIVAEISSDKDLIADLKQRLSELGIDYKTGRIIQ
jgi:hypothetical protein